MCVCVCQKDGVGIVAATGGGAAGGSNNSSSSRSGDGGATGGGSSRHHCLVGFHGTGGTKTARNDDQGSSDARVSVQLYSVM